MNKLTAAEKAYKQNPNSIIIIFTRGNAYFDRINNKDISEYKGQVKKTNFDNLLGNNNIPMFLINQASNCKYDFIGKCINKSCILRNITSDGIPICKFNIDSTSKLEKVNIKKYIHNDSQHKYRKQFLHDYGLKLLSGGTGDGIWLVISDNNI